MHSLQAPEDVVSLEDGCLRNNQQSNKSWQIFFTQMLVFLATLVVQHIYTLTGSGINTA